MSTFLLTTLQQKYSNPFGWGGVLVLVPLMAMGGGCLERLVDFRVRRLLGVEVKSIDGEGFSMTVRSQVENPNPVGATLANIRFHAWMGPHKVGAGQLRGPLQVAPRSRFILETPVRILYQDLPPDLPARVAGGSLLLRIAARLTARSSLGTFPLHLKGGEERVQVAQALQVAVRGPFSGDGVRVTGIRVAGLGLSGARLKVRLSVRNPFAFPLRIRRARCAIAINGDPFGQGILEAPLRLPPRSRRDVEVDVVASHGSMGKSIAALLRGDPRFRVKGDLWIDPLGGISRLPIDIQADKSILE